MCKLTYMRDCYQKRAKGVNRPCDFCTNCVSTPVKLPFSEPCVLPSNQSYQFHFQYCLVFLILMISILLFSLASNSGNDFNSSLLYYWKWLKWQKKLFLLVHMSNKNMYFLGHLTFSKYFGRYSWDHFLLLPSFNLGQVYF